MIDVHTKEVMGNMSIKLFQALESQMVTCEEIRQKSMSNQLPAWLSLSTTYDDIDESTGNNISSSDAAKRLKKRLNGRLRKWMGDQCSQVCSPLDAWDNYSAAISECRNQNDYMWLAGALEGSAVAAMAMLRLPGYEDFISRDLKPYIASMSQNSNTTVTPESALLKLVEDRVLEALSIYAKSVALCGLEAEGCLHLARLHESGSAADREQKV
jgi:hypothetical protein